MAATAAAALALAGCGGSSPSPQATLHSFLSDWGHTDWTAMGKSYVDSVAYFLDVLASSLEKHATDDLVLIVLGDHQPAAKVSGEAAPWDVPVHVITRRADILDALHREGFRDGLTPERPAIGKMNQLTLQLLNAFQGLTG